MINNNNDDQPVRNLASKSQNSLRIPAVPEPDSEDPGTSHSPTQIANSPITNI